VLDEIGEFVETARRDAGEEVVARLAARGGGVEWRS
jgi:hypothetical protein